MSGISPNRLRASGGWPRESTCGAFLLVEGESPSTGVVVRSREGIAGTIDMESLIFDEPFRGEVDNQDVCGGILGRNPYGGDKDDLRDFGSLGWVGGSRTRQS